MSSHHASNGDKHDCHILGPKCAPKYLPYTYTITSTSRSKETQESDQQTTRKNAIDLVLALFPEWSEERDSICCEPLKDGLTNTLIKVWRGLAGHSQEQNDRGAILIRAYGIGTGVLIDREREIQSHSLLAQHGLAPELLACFQNGLIYRYTCGQVCSVSDLQKEPVWKGIARHLAIWHTRLPSSPLPLHSKRRGNEAEGACSSNVSDCEHAQIQPIVNTERKATQCRPSTTIWTVMEKWIQALPSNSLKERQQMEFLAEQLRLAKAELDEPGASTENMFVFAHCDLLSGNVIILPTAKSSTDNINNEESLPASVSFIDYEYAVSAPAAFDIANHFSEWIGFQCDYNLIPTRSVRRSFVQEYIEASRQCMAEMDTDSPPTDPKRLSLDGLCDQVDRFRGLPGLYWGIWALIQAAVSQIDFDYASYAQTRLDEYLDWRKAENRSQGDAVDSLSTRELRWASE